MKKHLLAAAVAAAVAVPAMAQNVTVSGNINVGFQSVDTGVQGVGNFMRSNEGGLSGTDLFIQGSEDLGGGLKAAFIFRTDMPTNQGGTAVTWGKERAIELSGNFGAIRLGTTDITSAQAIDAAVSTFGDFGNTVKSANSGTVRSGEVGADKSSSIRWTSPKMNGLTVQAGVGNITAETSATDANKNTRIEGVYAAYEINNTSTVYAGWTQDSGVGAAKLKDTRFGAKTSLGGVNLGLLIARSDYSSALNGFKTTMLNAGYDLGAGTSAHIVYAKQKIDSVSNSEGNGYTLGLQKKLSKRTTIYGAYTSSEADSGALFEMQGVGTYSTAGKKASIVTTGILHTF